MVKCTGLLYSDHALKAMAGKYIHSYAIRDVINHGEIIKHYPDDKPYPGYLFLKFVSDRPLHVLMAQNPETKQCLLITCYEPDPKIWNLDFKDKTE